MGAFTGIIFGLSIFFLLWIRYKDGSLWSGLAIVLAALSSYLAAIWGSLYTFNLYYRGDIPSAPSDLGMFTLGGFLGAFTFNLALLFLFDRSSLGRLLIKAIAWAVPGGVLGLVSSALQKPVGGFVQSRLGLPVDLIRIDPALYTAFLVWQPGMAVAIALMMERTVSSEEPFAIPRSPLRLRLAGKFFFFSIFATAIVFGYYDAADKYREWKSEHRNKVMVRKMPSANDLPEVEPPTDRSSSSAQWH